PSTVTAAGLPLPTVLASVVARNLFLATAAGESLTAQAFQNSGSAAAPGATRVALGSVGRPVDLSGRAYPRAVATCSSRYDRIFSSANSFLVTFTWQVMQRSVVA